MSHGQPQYHLQDSSMQSHMLPPNPPPNHEWWASQPFLPHLDTSIDMLSGLGLSQSAGTTASPILQEEFSPRRSSVASDTEVSEWQEKVRIEVSSPTTF
jgi:hypothetical protein